MNAWRSRKEDLVMAALTFNDDFCITHRCDRDGPYFNAIHTSCGNRVIGRFSTLEAAKLAIEGYKP